MHLSHPFSFARQYWCRSQKIHGYAMDNGPNLTVCVYRDIFYSTKKRRLLRIGCAGSGKEGGGGGGDARYENDSGTPDKLNQVNTTAGG